uniref:Bardet-Biedl syndrome 7 n=1 Tax=Romanomermis culicivorax TaxID=13658 RepID=A0A915IC27_ROMCU
MATELGYTTSKNCLKLVPPRSNPSRNVLQKIVVGDHNGVLTCLSRSKNAFSIVFKTLPGTKIEIVKLGGALGTVQDKIFIACGSMVKGYSKKGKQFFAFETNSTEPIYNMYVYGVDVFLCGSYSMTHYRDCHEVNYYLCGDRINDLICLPVLEGGWVGRPLTPVLACDDRTLKVLKGSDLDYVTEVGGTPNILHLYENTGGSQGDLLLYGTKDGRLGLAQLPVDNPFLKWEISTSTNAAVTAIDCYNFSGNADTLDVIVGKQDGNIEIFSFDDDRKPKILQQFQNNEGVTSLCCGKVASLYYDEIVVCSYSGWIFSLTTEPSGKQTGSNEENQEKSHINKENDQSLTAIIDKLKGDIEELQTKVNSERDCYQKNIQKQNSLSAIPLFPINDNFTLNKEDASYTLTIELQSPVDYVLLQSAIPLDLLDVEKNAAVVSTTPCPTGTPNALLATFRCQANTTRMEMKVRSVEGQYGTLCAYISPKLHPAMCQVREYTVKPLSLHQRAHKFDADRPNSTLSLTGSFTMAECHSWIMFCLPDVPERCPDVARNQYWFVSSFLGTQLECSYG